MPVDMTYRGEQQGFKVYELGELYYLIMPTVATNRIIITAHGGHNMMSTTPKFTVPRGCNMRFYSKDGNSVSDPLFKNFYSKRGTAKEIIWGGGRCIDYNLTKYQGRHATNSQGQPIETYESIAKIVSNAVKFHNMQMASAQKAPTEAIRQRLIQGANDERVAAVLTVRNRHFQGWPTLSDAISRIKQAQPTITTFECVFCRYARGGTSEHVEFH